MLNRLIDRPIAVAMMLVVVLVLGISGMKLLPVSLIPNVDIPYMTVQVTYPSMSARELDDAVVKQLRQQLMQIAGLKDITTETKDGSGLITMTFEHGLNTDYLFIEANEKIDRSMGGMPKDMSRPVVIKAGATDIPAFFVNLTVKDDVAQGSKDDLFPVSDKFAQLSEFASQVIVKRLEQLPTVAMVDMSGYVTPEILILPEVDKIYNIGLTLPAFESAVRSVNITMGNLVIRDGEYQYNIKVQNRARNITDIEETYVKVEGRLYQIKDLARVVEHPQKRQAIVSSDGKDAIVLAVIKQSEAKMALLKKNINNLMNSFRNDYPAISFTVTRDQTELLDYSIDNLIQNIVLGIILACLVIMLFMRNLRSAFLVVLTIPIALILSMLFFYLLHISINIVSLSGMILGVGMMVDNSIITIDNINARWVSGWPLRKAVVDGTKEVAGPMLSSVLTTCSVFIPLIFLSGMAGAMFYDQAMAVTITLFCALGVTVTVIPVYYFLLYKRKESPAPNKYLTKLSFRKLTAAYEVGLRALFRRRWIVWGSLVLAVGGSLALFSIIRKEKLPDMTYQDVLLNIDWNERISVEENSDRCEALLAHIADMVGQSTIMSGSQQFILNHTRRMGISEAVIYLKEGNVPIGTIQDSVSSYTKRNYPEAVTGFEPSGNIFDIVFSDKEAKLVARLRTKDGRSPDPASLGSLIDSLSVRLPEIDLQPVVWQEHIVYVVKPEILALYDLTYSDVMSALKNAMNDNQLFTIVYGSRSIPVIVGENKIGLETILKEIVIKKRDVEIPIGLLLRETRAKDLKYITSGPEGNIYPLSISAQDKKIPQIIRTIREEVLRNHDYEVSFSGSYFSNRDMIMELAAILVIAVALLFFILASQFESLIQPLIILSEVLIDIFFILLALWLLGISINIMSLIGIIVCSGIIINDSILKVDTINKLRKGGMGLMRSVLVAGERRFKPIIMTSLTTILALCPFLAGGDMGSDLQLPLSVSVIVGMTVGTFISLYFVPIIYFSIYKRAKKR